MNKEVESILTNMMIRNNKSVCKKTGNLTAEDNMVLKKFIKKHGRNYFPWAGFIPVNYTKWSTIGKLIDIIESLDKNYSVNIQKYSTSIYRIQGLVFIKVSSAYTVYTYPFKNNNKISVTLKAIVGFCKCYEEIDKKDKLLIAFDSFLGKYNDYK